MALAYFRTDGDAAHPPTGLSLAEQEEAFRGYCQEQGYEPEASFVDSGASPGVQEPSGYHQLLVRLLLPQRPFTVVVVAQLDRLGPTPKEVMRRLLELESLGAPVYCLRERAFNPLPLALEVWQETWERSRRAGPVRVAMEAKALQGMGVGRPAYGYRIGLGGKFQPVAEEATVVERIFRLCGEEGLGLRRIAGKLNREGILTRRGGAWSLVALRDILRNRTYLGTYSRFGVRIPANHPPLVSSELFQKAQQRLTARSTKRTGGDRASFLLSGLLWCGACGGAMVGLRRRQSWTHGRNGSRAYGEYQYYQCGSRINQSRCDYHTRRAEELEDLIVQQLRSPSASGNAQAPMASPLRAEHAPREPRALDLWELLQRRVDGYLEQTVRGALSPEELRGKACPILWEIFTLREQAQNWRGMAPGSLDAQQWKTLPFLLRRALLQEMVERIVVYDDRVQVRLRHSSELPAEVLN